MSSESRFQDLGDEAIRLSSARLAELSDLDDHDALALSQAWPQFELMRRLNIVREMTDLAEDNVELNFDAVFKVAFRDEDPYVRVAAIRGLVEYEEPDIVPDLLDALLIDPDAEVRRESAVTLARYALAAELGRYSEQDAKKIRGGLIESAEDLEEDERVRAKAIEALGAMSGEDTENLIESIYEEESIWLKVGAVDAMGRTCSAVWLPIVMRETENRAPEMRHAAAYAMGEIGNETAVPQLKRMAVEDPDRQVQLAAIRSLGEIGGQQARVALTSVLYEGDDALRDAVEEAMAEIDFNDDPLGTLE